MNIAYQDFNKNILVYNFKFKMLAKIFLYFKQKLGLKTWIIDQEIIIEFNPEVDK